MKNLKKVQEVSAIDQFLAVMDLLKALGYETDKLSIKINQLYLLLEVK